jgi:hypothetical protein
MDTKIQKAFVHQQDINMAFNFNNMQRPNFTNMARQGLSNIGGQAPENIPGGAATQVQGQGQGQEQMYGYPENETYGQQPPVDNEIAFNPMARPAQPAFGQLPQQAQATNREQYLNRPDIRRRFANPRAEQMRKKRQMLLMEQRRRAMASRQRIGGSRGMFGQAPIAYGPAFNNWTV